MAEESNITIIELSQTFIPDFEAGVLYFAKGSRIGRRACREGSKKYYRVYANNTCYFAHRVLMALWNNSWPDGLVDHINHDKSDNRISNLRVVTPAQNHQNQRIRRANTSGHLGVSWSKQASKWLASIRVKGKTKHLGFYKQIEDAVSARKSANQLYGFHGNHGT